MCKKSRESLFQYEMGLKADIDSHRPLAYSVRMEFEWGSGKSDACFTARGFNFAFVLRAFMDADRLIRKDTRWDYGEDRYQLLGAIDGRVFFVAYTVRGTVIRIISARKANQREVHDYENSAREN